MKRIERWVLTLLVIHAVLMLASQLLINVSDVQVAINPVYEYIGVFSEKTTRKTLDQLLSGMLSSLR
ncbi:DUF5359 family protein [Aquibacillus kalidii]|uniref:DUF5359 family protein n=1 Tax=Aquibacillus kalidii TaxID=2762597 RepID=UPI00164813FD|nr:DUF5359 family protein [Aquibacillus kalidii]